MRHSRQAHVMELDIEHLRSWIGREETRAELLTPALAWKVALTFIIAVLALTLFCLLNEGFADRLRREED